MEHKLTVSSCQHGRLPEGFAYSYNAGFIKNTANYSDSAGGNSGRGFLEKSPPIGGRLWQIMSTENAISQK